MSRVDDSNLRVIERRVGKLPPPKARQNAAGIQSYAIARLCFATDSENPFTALSDTTATGRMLLSPREKQIKGRVIYQKNGVPAVPAAPKMEKTVVEPLPAVPRLPSTVTQVGDLYDPSSCYDLYTHKAIDMYTTCANENSFAKETLDGKAYIAEINATITGALSSSLSGCVSSGRCDLTSHNFTAFIHDLAAIVYTYERCSFSSILRTGLYAAQLVNWLRFWHPQQLLVMDYDKLFSSTLSKENVTAQIDSMYAHFLSSDLPLATTKGMCCLFLLIFMTLSVLHETN